MRFLRGLVQTVAGLCAFAGVGSCLSGNMSVGVGLLLFGIYLMISDMSWAWGQPSE
jgi:hypothetical protein